MLADVVSNEYLQRLIYIDTTVVVVVGGLSLLSVYLEGGGLFIGKACKLKIIHQRVAMSTTEHVISIFRPASA
jgi:hypothetical protein